MGLIPDRLGLAGDDRDRTRHQLDLVAQLGDVSLVHVEDILDFLLADLLELRLLSGYVVSVSDFGCGDFSQQFLLIC